MTNQLVAHLFRHEAGRMASVLTCYLGFARLDLAEDIVQDALVQALHTWPTGGIPDNPRAWLYRTAKNRALDVLRHEKQARQVSNEFLTDLPDPDPADMERLFFDDELNDSTLRMLFACCHPALAVEAQVAMCLKILCGLSVREIADAFLTAPDTIEKRLYRAKEKIRLADVTLAVPTGPQLTARLDAVLKSLYLLFNEGYNSTHPDALIRQDLCAEAMRLTQLLAQQPHTNAPPVRALLALMCFQSARFEARTDATGAIVLLADQDRSLWNNALIKNGESFLNQSAVGDTLSDYHLEAAIAACHCLAPSFSETNWPQILHYYDLLLARKPDSAIVALNRAVALAQVEGPLAAIVEVSNLTGLDKHHRYHAILGDLYQQNHQPDAARHHYQRAISLATAAAERALLTKKLGNC
jgi:RNA polymerase sigma factor (sigma-70 family)